MDYLAAIMALLLYNDPVCDTEIMKNIDFVSCLSCQDEKKQTIYT